MGAAFINLKFPLRNFRRGMFEGNDTTLSAVREDIKTLLLTMKGERVINVDIGTSLPVFDGIMFEQIQKSEMKMLVLNEVTDALSKWMPHVILENVEILTIDDDPGLQPTQIRIKMSYRLRNATTARDSLQFTIGG